MDEERLIDERLSALGPVIFIFFYTHMSTSFCASVPLSPCKRPRVNRTFQSPCIHVLKILANLHRQENSDPSFSGFGLSLSNCRNSWCIREGQFWGKPGQTFQIRHRQMPRIGLAVKIIENEFNINSEYLVIIPVFFCKIVLFIVKSRDLCSLLINQWLFIIYLLLLKMLHCNNKNF
jgi:hypothetical protein